MADIEQEVRRRIWEVMNGAGITLSQLSELAQINMSTLQKVLALQPGPNQRGVSLGHLFDIARGLNLDPITFLHDGERPIDLEPVRQLAQIQDRLRTKARSLVDDAVAEFRDVYEYEVRLRRALEEKYDEAVRQAESEILPAPRRRRKPGGPPLP